VLSGQPTNAQLATPYTVTATNVSGEASQQFVLTVTASFPVFTLSLSNQIVGQGSAAGFTVVSTGGAATFTISARPTGMSFDALTGELSGNPSVVKSTTTLLVTATNASGRATQRFTLTVNPAIPEFVLSESSATVAVGEEVGFTTSSTGGSISKFSISPNAPSGMVFSSQSGSLFGFPRFEQLATTYTVTGVGSGGSSTQQFVLTVNAKAPVFRLSRYTQTVVKGSAAGFTVNSTGGLISRFTIDPAAPAGMSFNTSTGVLSGSPTGAQLATTYTVTATNVSGSPTQSFELTVTASFPAFTLSSSSQTVAQGDSAGFTVISTGGVATYSISATPTGMTFNTSTGALSGSPSVVKSEFIYTVTATNVSGRATQQFRLTVNPATPEFVLSRSFHNAAAGSASGFTVNSTGGYVSSFSMSPSAPAGMLFSSVTGTLSGKPKSLQLATVYTVTATNDSGSASQEFELSVTRTGSDPSFVLSFSIQSVNQDSAAGFTVSSTGGAISSFSISPDAPAGMSFNTSTGVLSGSPTSAQLATTYTVTGANSFASTTRTYVLTVRLVAPAFTLTLSSQTVYQGDVAGFAVNSTGGVATYSIDLVPTGMSFNTSTGALSGNPSTIKSITTYTVTARNALGSASQEFLLTVNVKVPVFTLSLSTQTVAQGSAAGFTVSSTGGAATYSISATPTGMSFNTSTGVLSGSPSVVKVATTYTVTAENASGSPTRSFVLTVNVKAPAFTLSTSVQTVTQGSAAGFTVTSTGGVATYSISATPTGMSFNTTTGQLSGSPTNAQASTTYTVTATNVSGWPTQTYRLTVSAKSCAAGGTCSLGEPGPGGGTVVFVDEGGFACLANLASICRYMEAVDPSLQLKWSGNTTTSVLGTSDAIGAGYKNNELAIIQSGTLNTAIRKAWDFSQNEKSDWNLPSAGELQQVWNEFTPKNSWTSTQHATANMAKMGKSTGGFQGFLKTGTPWIFYVRCFG
jgi:LysM repeat protein